MEVANNQYKDLNLEVFKFFNNNFGQPQYDDAINFGSQLGKHNNFYVYLIIALIFVSLKIYNNKHDLNTLREIVISWFTVGVVLLLSFTIGYAFIILIKNYTSMPRPFCGLENIYVINDVTNKLECKMSFPSGHISFLVIMTASFWSVFNRAFKILAVMLVLFVAITRMAAGAHYPMDLLGAAIITLPLTLYIHHKVTYFVWHYENKKSIFGRIYNRFFK